MFNKFLRDFSFQLCTLTFTQSFNCINQSNNPNCDSYDQHQVVEAFSLSSLINKFWINCIMRIRLVKITSLFINNLLFIKERILFIKWKVYVSLALVDLFLVQEFT